MRRLLVILIPLIPFIVNAQLLNTVEQIATYNNPYAQLVFVKDTIRGGHFLPYNGTAPIDNGLIFQDALNRKWIRQTDVDYVNLDWYGAKTDGSDSRSIFLTTLASAKANLPVPKIRIPRSYFFSDSVNINDYVEIFGDGMTSKITFAQHKKGITFTNPGTHYAVLRDITLTSISSAESPRNTWDSTKHGVVICSPMYLSNVWVSNFDGSGFYMVNSLNAAVPGNSNTSTFTQCHSYYNLLHGFYSQGADVNDMTFKNCDAVGNGGVGFFDKSFLGNHYEYNHAASNGAAELVFQRGLVKSGGTVYACIKDGTINVAPPNTTYWQNIGTGWINSVNIKDYNATTVYYTVGSYVLEGANQYGTLTGNYSELDQAPGYIDIGNTDIRSNIVCRNIPTRLYSNLGRLTSLGFLYSEVGIGSSWLYGGNMSSYADPYVSYPNHTGILVGSNNKSGIVDFWDNNTKIGEISTTPTTLKIQATTVNIVGTLQNNGSPISGGGISQQTLNDSTAALRTFTTTGLSGKQNTLGNGSITNAMLAGSIDLTTKVTGTLPFGNGGISASAAAPATTGAMTINMTSSIITITPTGNCTFNASGGVAGQIVTFSITTSGTTSFTLTFGTNFRKTGTLATGTTNARFFTVTFRCLDGTTWTEMGRTAAQT